MTYHITLPLKDEDVLAMKIGDEVLLDGWMLVGRDQVHKRISSALRDGEQLPVSLEHETIFYMGPAPAPEGHIIGSCGPTTAARMDPFVSDLLDQGLLCMIGKGPRSREVSEAVKSHGALYLAAFGGCGALYAACVKEVECLAYEDLGPEALYRIRVESFPAIVAIDPQGHQIYDG